MANELASKTVGVYVNDGTIESPDWLLVVCTTEKSIELTIGNQEVNNDCTGKESTNRCFLVFLFLRRH